MRMYKCSRDGSRKSLFAADEITSSDRLAIRSARGSLEILKGYIRSSVASLSPDVLSGVVKKVKKDQWSTFAEFPVVVSNEGVRSLRRINRYMMNLFGSPHERHAEGDMRVFRFHLLQYTENPTSINQQSLIAVRGLVLETLASIIKLMENVLDDEEPTSSIKIDDDPLDFDGLDL